MTIIGTSTVEGSVGAMDRSHSVRSIERKASKRSHAVGAASHNMSSNIQARFFMARNLVQYAEKLSIKKKDGNGQSKNRSCSKVERTLSHRS